MYKALQQWIAIWLLWSQHIVCNYGQSHRVYKAL
jgi:hypothetical protein